MTREDLFSLCQTYVRCRESDPVSGAGPTDPAPEIVRSFTLAEISESEMEALLAYVGDPEDEDVCDAARVAIDRYDDFEPPTGDDDEPDTPPPAALTARRAGRT
jgi:hypothetical protein